jgi:glutathione S-transferase
LPSDKLLRTRALEWMCFEQTHVDGVISRARFRRRFPDAIPTRPEEFVAWHAEGVQTLGVLDAHLATRPFLVGDRYSVADIALYAYTHKSDEAGIDLAPFASLRRWFRDVEAQPGYWPIDRVPPAAPRG